MPHLPSHTTPCIRAAAAADAIYHISLLSFFSQVNVGPFDIDSSDTIAKFHHRSLYGTFLSVSLTHF